MIEEKIIFCFPYKKGAGGVSMMFMRLASFLKKKGQSVALIDYPNGEMASNNESEIEIIPYFDNKGVVVPSNSILVFQSMTPWAIYPSLIIDEKTKIFFISTLPANFYPVIPGPLRNIMYEGGKVARIIWQTFFRSEYFKSKKFLCLIEDKKAHAILDTDILCNLEKGLNLKVNAPQFLPLFSVDSERNLYLDYAANNLKKESITLGWVGRLADFKVPILNRVIKDAYAYSSDSKVEITFFIVGSGELQNKLEIEESNHFSIVLIPYIRPSDLDDFFLSLDMLFAMGTSALDGAKLGVPTIRLDYSYGTVSPTYRYKYFFEVQGYSMGERIDSCCFTNGKNNFNDLMAVLEKNKMSLSEKCFDWYKNNHSISHSASLFIKYLSDSRLIWQHLTVSDVLSSFVYSMWLRFKLQNK